MKTIIKTFIQTSLVMFGIVLFAVSAIAATTASLSPTTVNVTTGQKFTINISVNPQGTPNFAEKVEIIYPAETLEISSFSFASNWMPLTQPGYDSTDNTNGVMIKTAGYPGGITNSTMFGTVSFTVKKSGSGTIKIGNSSLAFEANSQSAITGNETVFNVSTPAVVPIVVPAKPPTTKPTTQIAPKAETQPTVPKTTNTAPVQEAVVEPTPNTQVAAVVASGSQSYVWLWILPVILVLVLFGWWIYRRKSRTGL